MTQNQPPKNPIAYAEDVLGSNEILAKTIEAREKLDEALTLLSESRDARRFLEHKIEDREMYILIAERSKHPEMSATAMKDHMKVALHGDRDWLNMRSEMRDLNDKIDGVEMDRSILTRDIEIGCARMNELGGYFNYLAAVKNASVARTTRSE